MIRIFFQGGLGNQMFQYAAARCLAERIDTTLCFDLSWYYFQPERRFLLSGFGIDAPVKKSLLSCCANRFLGKPLFELAGRKSVYREPSRVFDPQFFKLQDGCSIIGFFQSESYFKSVESVIRAEFSDRLSPSGIVEKERLKRLQSVNSVAVHIRRGDYLTFPKFNVCTENYYREAMAFMREQLSQPRFILFSDDLSWCKDVFSGEDIEYCDGIIVRNDPLTDLQAMAECRHHIIANSSYSWWAAWLGKSADQVVVAPDSWRANNCIAFDIYCDGWVLLSG